MKKKENEVKYKMNFIFNEKGKSIDEVLETIFKEFHAKQIQLNIK